MNLMPHRFGKNTELIVTNRHHYEKTNALTTLLREGCYRNVAVCLQFFLPYCTLNGQNSIEAFLSAIGLNQGKCGFGT